MGSIGGRELQKGLVCTVEGCYKLRRSKGLCMNHGMALRRYGNVDGGKHVVYECAFCEEQFVGTKKTQKYCSNKCYKKSPEGKSVAYAAVKAYRLRTKEKLHEGWLKYRINSNGARINGSLS